MTATRPSRGWHRWIAWSCSSSAPVVDRVHQVLGAVHVPARQSRAGAACPGAAAGPRSPPTTMPELQQAYRAPHRRSGRRPASHRCRPGSSSRWAPSPDRHWLGGRQRARQRLLGGAVLATARDPLRTFAKLATISPEKGRSVDERTQHTSCRLAVGHRTSPATGRKRFGCARRRLGWNTVPGGSLLQSDHSRQSGNGGAEHQPPWLRRFSSLGGLGVVAIRLLARSERGADFARSTTSPVQGLADDAHPPVIRLFGPSGLSDVGRLEFEVLRTAIHPLATFETSAFGHSAGRRASESV